LEFRLVGNRDLFVHAEPKILSSDIPFVLPAERTVLDICVAEVAIGAASGMRPTVRTLQDALVLVGWRRLQSWVALLMVADPASDNVSEEVTMALVRARACELLTQAHAPELTDAAFTAGMLIEPSAAQRAMFQSLTWSVEASTALDELRRPPLVHS